VQCVYIFLGRSVVLSRFGSPPTHGAPRTAVSAGPFPRHCLELYCNTTICSASTISFTVRLIHTYNIHLLNGLVIKADKLVRLNRSVSSGCNLHELKHASVNSLRNLLPYSFHTEKNICGKGMLLCFQTVYNLDISDKATKKWMMMKGGRDYSENVKRFS
jgi:hypothetical protein